MKYPQRYQNIIIDIMILIIMLLSKICAINEKVGTQFKAKLM